MQFKNPFKRWEGNTIFETIKVIVISLIIIIPIRTYLMEPFYVKGSSMEPNFYTYDYLLISKLKYRISEPDRGNIVVAKFSEKKPYVIKRIVGLPNETIEIKDKKVRITQDDGEAFYLEEEYLATKNIKNEDITLKTEDNQYVLLGDNRKVSLDSRQQGPVDGDGIKGKVMVKVLNFEFIMNAFHKIIPEKQANSDIIYIES